MRRSSLVLLLAISTHLALGQTAQQQPQVFTRADSLRGMNSEFRSCYDITYYALDIKVDIEKKFIQGSNTIRFNAVEPFDKIQVDLFANMNVDRVLFEGKELAYTREFNAVFLSFPRTLKKSSVGEIVFFYSGNPTVAQRPPWSGGFTWEKDQQGNPWVVITCQGTGASLWWPNKDHQADEPDSMLLSVTIPKGLQDISNGRLRKVTELPGGWTRFDWFISYPINNYNVTLNIGKYAHFGEVYMSGKDSLTLDYYVMPYNLEKAREQFKQVKLMMAAFEHYFGPYPFIRDGYKLVESPHTGMEHQSAVAYGNWYINGYRGRASSEIGLTFDFIIIHETAHEWWGNSVTSKDIADMWFHESFGAYAEALFVEYHYGFEKALGYINGKKSNVRNDRPIIGVYNVHRQGSGDMYDKGQLVLNTLRSVMNNDKLWFEIVYGLANDFKYQTITADDVFRYINTKTGQDLSYFYDQYFRHTSIPRLDVIVAKKGGNVTASYRWSTDVPNFRMPILVTTSRGKFEFIYPTTTWQSTKLGDILPEEFRVAEDRFLVDVRFTPAYRDPRLPD